MKGRRRLNTGYSAATLRKRLIELQAEVEAMIEDGRLEDAESAASIVEDLESALDTLNAMFRAYKLKARKKKRAATG